MLINCLGTLLFCNKLYQTNNLMSSLPYCCFQLFSSLRWGGGWRTIDLKHSLTTSTHFLKAFLTVIRAVFKRVKVSYNELFINDVIFGGYPRFSLQTTHVLKVYIVLSIHGWSEVTPAENDDVIYEQPPTFRYFGRRWNFSPKVKLTRYWCTNCEPCTRNHIDEMEIEKCIQGKLENWN